VTFKVPNKAAGNKLLTEMWVAGNRFKALPFIADKADTLCGHCSQWGHSEFRCHGGAAACAICSGAHRTEEHRCEVATCGKWGKVCPHTVMRCPNCKGNHPAQDARCKAKGQAIGLARGPPSQRRAPTHQPRRELSPPRRLAGDPPAVDWTDTAEAMDVSGMESSGTAPPVAV